MRLTLRQYQQANTASIRQAYIDGKKAVLYVAPTGSGKTVCFCYIAESAVQRRKRIYICVHRRELIQQCSRSLTDAGVSHGVIAPGFLTSTKHVQVCSVQTLVRRMDTLPKPDLLIVDEAHHLSSNQSSWRKVADYYAGCRILGVTATPCRLDGAGLGVEVGGIFDSMVVGPSIQQLTDLGFITPCDVYSPPSDVNLDKLHTVAGDYAKDEMEAEMDRPVITGNAVKHYSRICPDVPAIAFCVSVQHAKNVAQEFMAAGFMAQAVDGTMREEDRDIAMAGLRNGSIRIITSCEIISEGVDVPCVTAGIMLRPTESMGLWLQQAGRILRPSAGKTKAIILDHCGNAMRHGLPHEDREWDLNATKEDRRKKASDAIPLRQCPKCFFVHHPLPKCPKCGWIYEIAPRKVEEKDGELKILSPEEFAVRREKMKARQVQGQCKELKALIQLAIQRHYKNPAAWAKYVWAGRQRQKDTYKAGEPAFI